ncbi:MAG TPA: hypothetical protein VMW24_21325 [Sedimentisphaerales bacterium]|nr:hypothetical protein [Sedimentisphaerales bacterium]
MGIAKRIHQKIVEGVITHERGERIVKRLLTPPAKPVTGEQLELFRPRTSTGRG